MPLDQTFAQDLDKKNILKLRNILNDLPSFCGEFIRGIEPTTSILTRIAYAYDLRIFFNFLCENISEFKDKSPTSINLSDLNKITSTHLEIFLEYLSYYVNDNDIYKNTNPGKARKLSTLRSFFSYFFKKQKIDKNITTLVDFPKLHEKAIIRLEVDEVAKLLDVVETGQGLSKTQKRYHKYTKSRDLAILALFLGTGIRISECIGLNIDDFDFSVNGFKITRKGGNQVVLYFSDEVKQILLEYIEQRKQIQPLAGHEQAFFLSLQKKRISKRAVQNLVKKYSSLVTQLKNISPHKLRSTYGTNLYRETGDIYLVADVLGHKDVNTTRKHYAAISDDKRRRAAKMLKLRD